VTASARGRERVSRASDRVRTLIRGNNITMREEIGSRAQGVNLTARKAVISSACRPYGTGCAFAPTNPRRRETTGNTVPVN